MGQLPDHASGWVLAFGALGLASLVPIVWAIVDVLRRPAWQFPVGRKVLWVATLALGFLIGLWPVALVSAVLYLAVFRKRLPEAQAAGEPPPPPPPPSLPPAGWYPDPSGRPGQRWWDGRGWSEHVRQ